MGKYLNSNLKEASNLLGKELNTQFKLIYKNEEVQI